VKVFIVLRKDSDDYSSLPADAEKVFLFDKIGNPSPEYAAEVLSRIHIMLANVDAINDRIIFNGPSWVIALVGHHWLADALRMESGILAYDNFKRKYIEVNNAY
jgi:hypothetical protein